MSENSRATRPLVGGTVDGFESFEDIEGMSLLDLVASKKVDEFKKLLKQLSKGEAPPPRYETEAVTLDGNHFPAVMEFTPATYEGETCLQVILRKQEEVFDPKAAEELERLRQIDQVTGLLNRQTFLRALEDAVAETAAKATSHGVLLIEPDHYMRLLQDIGLDAADDLAMAIAGRLRSVASPDDVLARFGEHQFAVMTRNSDHAQTARLAESLRTAFAGSVLEARSHSLNVTLSIGGVQVGEKIANVPAILAKASHGLQSTIGVGGNPESMLRAAHESQVAFSATAFSGTPLEVIRSATLNGAQETPPNNSTATGRATLLLSPDEKTARVSLTFAGLSSGKTESITGRILPLASSGTTSRANAAVIAIFSSSDRARMTVPMICRRFRRI